MFYSKDDSFLCPYCNNSMGIHESTYSRHTMSFEPGIGFVSGCLPPIPHDSTIEVLFLRCPVCNKYSIFAHGIGPCVKNLHMCLIPSSEAKQFPDYIPQAIRNDYEEACAILTLSPKSSATLARRCLQGMIRDFWGVSKSRLTDEIDALQDKIPAQQWRVIDGLRRIGNIGAHMERDVNCIVDIEASEAEKLVKLLEHLIEQWYINRHEQELLYADIIGIDEQKQSVRKKKE